MIYFTTPSQRTRTERFNKGYCPRVQFRRVRSVGSDHHLLTFADRYKWESPLLLCQSVPTVVGGGTLWTSHHDFIKEVTCTERETTTTPKTNWLFRVANQPDGMLYFGLRAEWEYPHHISGFLVDGITDTVSRLLPLKPLWKSAMNNHTILLVLVIVESKQKESFC